MPESQLRRRHERESKVTHELRTDTVFLSNGVVCVESSRKEPGNAARCLLFAARTSMKGTSKQGGIGEDTSRFIHREHSLQASILAQIVESHKKSSEELPSLTRPQHLDVARKPEATNRECSFCIELDMLRYKLNLSMPGSTVVETGDEH